MIDGQQKSKHSTPPCVSETLDPAACSNTFKALNQKQAVAGHKEGFGTAVEIVGPQVGRTAAAHPL